jgi:transcriptional regulator with XRE-family HTH domain
LKSAKALGRNLRKLRERAGLSQGDIAGERYDRSFIAQLESGSSVPSLDTLAQRAAARGSPRALIPKDL